MERKTTRELVSFRINSVQLARLEAIAERLGRNRSEILDRAIEEYLERHEDQQKHQKPAK